MPAHVVVRDLRQHYGDLEVLHGLTFTVAPGEILGLLGPNGAGKTTTLECLTGLRRPTGGEILVGGVDALRQAAEARQRIGVVLQDTALPERITPHEALALFGGFYRDAFAPEVLLERFGLTGKAHARFDTLSGGQRQRLALALALVNRPTLLVLDEPSAGLDPQARRELHTTISRLRADGHTVILATHDLEEAGRLCDRLAVLHHGRLIATGTPQDLLTQAGRPATLEEVFLELTKVDREAP